MIDINKQISIELKIGMTQVANALDLWLNGATVPFIARYRKEVTGELNEIQLRDIFDRYDYLKDLEERKETILKSIEEQDKLTDELRTVIESCLVKTELEDLYLPYKPKKRTRATIAKEKGLLPLAEAIKGVNIIESPAVDLDAIALGFINTELGVLSSDDALNGAGDIIAEEISEIAELRAWTRDYLFTNASFVSGIKDEFPKGTTKYEMYREYETPVKTIAPHNMLALRRGESEGILTLGMKFDETEILSFIAKKVLFSRQSNLVVYYTAIIKDSFNRLMKNSLISDIRLERKKSADETSINVFGDNLRQILLSAPAGMHPTLGIDPGFRTGCKAAVVDKNGKFLEYGTIFPFQSDSARQSAENTLLNFINKHKIRLIAIGNGTAGRETDEFVTKVLNSSEIKPLKVMVSEAGASVYSASTTAAEEFPELDVSIRGAISIARRLQDPLAESVKIDPKSIGVGQYQHDVDQKLLKTKLEEIVESCVNFVGVDINTASKELLMYVSGINKSLAKNIIEWRNQHGSFKNRYELMKISKFGDKAFEQSAGFLRIREGENELDNTAVHPEAYDVVKKIAADMGLQIKEITRFPDRLDNIDLKKFVDEKFGLPTLRDIISELKKPGRDPREEFKYANFSDAIKEIKDLNVGMELEGVVTNITNFGAFVDIGVHQDGLVHVSEISRNFIKDPASVLKVGQIVKVRVISVDLNLSRIQLSMKQAGTNPAVEKQNKKSDSEASLDDLRKKFGKSSI